MDVLPCDCCSAEIKALFTEWIECYGREHRLIQSNEVSNHGIKIGMGRTQNEEKKAVECGYSLFSADAIEAPLELLHIWHYNPDEDGQVLKAANTDGKEEIKVSYGFHLDSKEPDWSKLLTALIME